MKNTLKPKKYLQDRQLKSHLRYKNLQRHLDWRVLPYDFDSTAPQV